MRHNLQIKAWANKAPTLRLSKNTTQDRYNSTLYHYAHDFWIKEKFYLDTRDCSKNDVDGLAINSNKTKAPYCLSNYSLRSMHGALLEAFVKEIFNFMPWCVKRIQVFRTINTLYLRPFLSKEKQTKWAQSFMLYTLKESKL